MRATEAVARFGGRADRAALLRHITSNDIAVAIRSGDLVRTARGIYVLPTLPDERAIAAACRGVISHSSAAALHGLELVAPPTAVHVTAARGARPRVPKRARLHRCTLAGSDVDGDLTSLVRTVMDCCVDLPFREALAVADSALHRVGIDELVAAAGRPGPGRVRRMSVIEAADARSANAFESALRGSLLDAGIQLTPQLLVQTHGGVYRVDLGDASRRLAVEADSFTWHGSRDALQRDCRRYDELVRAGWRVLRFSWEHVMFEPEWVVDTVAEVLAHVA